MIDPKKVVLRRFLAFVGQFVPLSNAHLATLGGLGVEPELWKEFGVLPENGWLIERSRSRGPELIAAHRYRMVNQLSSFAQILGGREHAFIDGFHLDLCGTLSSKVITTFMPAFKFVLASTGRCLAITVADARRNLILEKWPAYNREADRIFHGNSSSLYEWFLAEQHAMPQRKKLPKSFKLADLSNAAKRELGFLVDLAKLMRICQAHCTQMERYVYVSSYSGSPFRMRTYLFHFTSGSSVMDSLKLAALWQASPLHFVSDSGVELVTSAPSRIEAKSTLTIIERNTMSAGTSSRLGALAKTLGGAELQEYEQLLEDSRKLTTIQAALEAAGMSKLSQSSVSASTPLVSPSVQPDHHSRKKHWGRMTDQEQILWLIETQELRAQNKGWPKGSWEKHLRGHFGKYDVNLGATLRASLARTSKKFRPFFVARIEKAFPKAEADVLLARIAKV